MNGSGATGTFRTWGELHVPQTNTQLYGLLIDLGFGETGLARVRRVHDFAERAFSGRYQGCGKPFVMHGIGTAGILALLDAPPELVAAAIVHNGYRNADLGGINPYDHDAARRFVQGQIGAEVERYLERFLQMRPGRFRGPVDDLPPLDREVLWLHSAETLEKMIDGAIAFWEVDLEEFLESARSRIPICRSLGHLELAEWLVQAIAGVRNNPAPPYLRNRPRSYVALPPSASPRPGLAIRRRWRTSIRRARIMGGRWTRRLGLRK